MPHDSIESLFNDFLILLAKAQAICTSEQFAAFSHVITTVSNSTLIGMAESGSVTNSLSGASSALIASAGAGRSVFERAQMILKFATLQGFQWPSREKCWQKVLEEISELTVEVENDDRIKLQEELGDLFLTLISFADFEGLNPEKVLEQAADKFTKRYQVLEEEAASQNKTVLELTPAEREGAWQKAKAQGL